MKPSLAAGFLAALLCLAPPAVPAQQLFTEDNAANPVVIDRMYLQ